MNQHTLQVLFMCLGGFSLLAHLFTQGIPRLVALLFDFLRRHPSVIRAMYEHRQEIESDMDKFEVEFKKNLDASGPTQMPRSDEKKQ